jgi:hypothetical protein
MSTVSLVHRIDRDVRVVDLPLARRRRRPPLAVLALLGWIVASAGICSVGLLSHGLLRGVSPASLGVAKIAIVIVIGAVFTRAARGRSPELIVATGLCWLVLSIAADFVSATRSLDPAFRLLGDPAVAPKSLRDLTMLIWLASPALFARRSDPWGDRSRR